MSRRLRSVMLETSFTMSDSDEEGLSGAVDPVLPWTIRAISVEARDIAIGAGHKEGMSVGQWLDRLIRRECEGGTALAVQQKPAPPALPASAAARPTKLERVTSIAAAVAELGKAGVLVDPDHARRLTEALVDALPAPRKADS